MEHVNPEPILLVDDDQSVLDALRRTHRKSFAIRTACGVDEGLRMIDDEGPFAVVVSDYQMPIMNGVTFLSRVRQEHPDAVRIMLTGNADIDSAIDAVNRGHVFRFLRKPCSAANFASGIDAALAQYRLQQAERLLLEETVRGCVEVLSDVLALTNPAAFGRSLRVRGYVNQIARVLKLGDPWIHETAALLSQIGLVAIPADIIEKIVTGESLSSDYDRAMDRHPEISRRILSKIPRLETVAEIVALQQTRSPTTANASLNPEIRLGGQILSLALEFDKLTALGATNDMAIKTIEGYERHPAHLIAILKDLELDTQGIVIREHTIDELEVDMVLDEDVETPAGAMVVARGNKITQFMIERLRNYRDLRGVKEPIRVRVVGTQSTPIS